MLLVVLILPRPREFFAVSESREKMLNIEHYMIKEVKYFSIHSAALCSQLWCGGGVVI